MYNTAKIIYLCHKSTHIQGKIMFDDGGVVWYFDSTFSYMNFFLRDNLSSFISVTVHGLVEIANQSDLY